MNADMISYSEKRSKKNVFKIAMCDKKTKRVANVLYV